MSSERKKILWLCSWYPVKTAPFNGDFIQRHARAAALYNDIYVICVTGDESRSLQHTEKVITRSAGLTEHTVLYKRSASWPGRVLSHMRFLFLSRQAIRRYMVEHGKPDLVHVQVPMKAGLQALWLKKKSGIPYLVTEHWGIYNEVVSDHYLRRSSFFRRTTKKIFSQAAGFTSVSRYLAEAVNRMVIKKDYTITRNVVDTRLFFPGYNKQPGFRFIHVSNMVPLKNAEGILSAFRLFLEKGNDAILIMIGDTDPAARQKAAGLNLPREKVQFRGEIPYEGVAAEMQEADCLVLFSDIENSPCVIGEALCCGLPVIATNTGGIPELVDKQNGILVEPRNEPALAAAMEDMLKHRGRYDREQVAREARNLFSYDTIGKQLDDLYSNLAGPENTPR